MSFKKFNAQDQIRGLVQAAKKIQAEEQAEQLRLVFVAPVPDCVVNKLREMKVRVTRESYAELAYWKPYRTLSTEEKQDVRQAVYEANIQ